MPKSIFLFTFSNMMASFILEDGQTIWTDKYPSTIFLAGSNWSWTLDDLSA